MARLGMDADTVESIGRELGASANSIERVVREIDGLVAAIPGQWLGPSVTRYITTWQTSLRQQTAACGHAVAGLSRTALTNAANQREVSGRLDGAPAVPQAGGPTWPGLNPGDPVPPPAPGLPNGTSSQGFTVGPPTQPTFSYDEDFDWNSKEPSWQDYVNAAKWKAKLEGGRALRADLDDATAAYARYWENSGEPLRIDFAEAYAEDSTIRSGVDAEVTRARLAAQELIGKGGREFSMQGAPSAGNSQEENWLKTLGAFNQWSDATVSVKGDQVTMVVTVHAEDRYNFNRGMADVHTGAPDSDNGRFQELGWAKSFMTSGELTRTVTWSLGDPAPPVTESGPEAWNPGREDRAPSVPEDRDGPRNDRDTGRARVL